MMGERRVMQEALFYGFSLERHVPDDHLLRKIDRFVDLSEVRAHLGPYYSDVGRPSIDPELMIRMLIVGYSFGFAQSESAVTSITCCMTLQVALRCGAGAENRQRYGASGPDSGLPSYEARKPNMFAHFLAVTMRAV